jgi:hypothetical protein
MLMRKTCLVFAALIVSMTVISVPAKSASVLTSCHYFSASSNASLDPYHVKGFLIGFTDPFHGAIQASFLENWTMDALAANVGQTIWVRSNADDPHFSTAVSVLTNGVNDNVGIFLQNLTGGGGSYYSESDAFLHRTGPPDFSGYNITGLGWLINSASQTYIDGRSRGAVDLTFFIEGQVVPEPSAMLTLAGCCVCTGLSLLRRRRMNR